MKRAAIVATVAVLFSTIRALPAAAKDPGGEPPRQAISRLDPSFEKLAPSIEKLVSAIESAFNRGDAKALAACWTPGGDMIGFDGQRSQGQGQLEKHFGELFAANKGLKLKLSVLSIHLVGQSAAVVDASAELSPPLPTLPAEPRSTLVLQLHDGHWLVETARDTLVYSASNYHNLKAIEWLIGDWSDEPAAGAGAHLHSSCAWTADKNFLIRKYSMGGTGRRAVTGTEVIGWDPRRHRIRAWNFDSNGGYGESTWQQEGDHWVIRHSGVLPDGSEVSALHVVSRLDGDTVSLKSQERTINGQREPDAKEVVVHRLPPAEAAAPAAAVKPAAKTTLP
jgi:uncharacterized protein (TIGR02246 family)